MNDLCRVAWLRRTMAAFGLILFAITWRLWTPQTDFPQIPFFGWLVDVPGGVDWIALVGTFIGLTTILFVNDRWSKPAIGLFLVSTSLLVLLNQHRLQPWAYQFVVFAIILATMRARSAFFWLRIIVISIYVYSAISKFDYQFVHTTGRLILQALAALVGQDASSWSESLQNWLTLGLPLGELLLGVALIFSKTRKLGMVGAVFTHALLLVVLIWLGHSWGVLAWNLYFIAQSILLFGFELEPPRFNDKDATAKGNENVRDPIATRKPMEFFGLCIAVFVLLFPLTRPLGICDHWMAWEVYAPRCSRAKLLCNASRAPYSNLLNWSEATTGVPVYPQARLQLAICIATKQRYTKTRNFPVEVSEPSNFWTGERESVTLNRKNQILMFADRYWLNMKPRNIWFR